MQPEEVLAWGTFAEKVPWVCQGKPFVWGYSVLLATATARHCMMCAQLELGATKHVLQGSARGAHWNQEKKSLVPVVRTSTLY